MTKRKTTKVVRSTRHLLRDVNKEKLLVISRFIDEYKTIVQTFVDHLWSTRIEWEDKDGNCRVLDIKNQEFDCPQYIDYKDISVESILSARAFSSASNQAISIVKSRTKEPKKLKNKDDAWSVKRYKFLLEKLSKPDLERVNPELSSKNMILGEPESAHHFDRWLTFKAIGFHDPIEIPIRFNRYTKRFIKEGYTIAGSFLLNKDFVEIRWVREQDINDEGEILGCDTGLNNLATFSQGDNDHNDLSVNGVTYKESVQRVARKRKGSKNHQRARHHRDCIIRHVINQAKPTIQRARIIYLEDNGSLKQGRRTSRNLVYHAYGVIRRKLEQVSEELGVQVSRSSSYFKSQRCSKCGWVQKSNRQSQAFFKCKDCGFEEHADKNAAMNNVMQLPLLDFESIKRKRLNLKGFRWLPLAGSLESPV